MTHSQKLSFEALPNTRDLGGIPTRFGIIKRGKLLRSGMLHDATPNDIDRLVNELNVRTVIDLRMPLECSEKPDPELPDAERIFLSVLTMPTTGITHEDGSLPTAKEQIDQFFDKTIPPIEATCRMYRGMVSNAHAQREYGRFFDALCEERSGAVLWHCSVGKDRVGLATAMLLAALGASEADIVEDYLFTQNCMQESIERQVQDILQKLGLPSAADEIRIILGVEPDYIRAALDEMRTMCGSVDNYLTEKIGLTQEKRQQLISLYVE